MKAVAKGRAVTIAAALAATAWLIATRLAQIYGQNGFLDGDESILALMALHLTAGRPALFFYGQSFGLAILEAAPVAAAFSLFGASTPAVKWTMLVLWSAGAGAFALALRRAAGGVPALLGFGLLVACPAFGAWSTMARGYHVAAFTLMQLALWQAFELETRPRPARVAAVLLGSTVGLLFLTNAIWLVALLPFLSWLAVNRRDLTEVGCGAAGLILVVGGLYAAAAGSTRDFWAPDFLHAPDPVAALLQLPGRLRVMMSGAYSYGSPTQAGPAATLAGWTWMLASAGILVHGGWLAARRRPLGLRWPCLVSVLSILALSLLIAPRAFGFRYLLPVVPGLVLFLGLELAESGGRRRLAALFAAALAVSGAASLIEAPPRWRFVALVEDAPREDEALRALVRDLEAAGIRHVYSLHPTLQWAIIFYSHEDIAARFVDPVDRLPAYPQAVDAAFRGGEPVAIVGAARQWESVRGLLEVPGGEPVRISGGRFFWVTGVSEELLGRLGFRLSEPGA